MVDQIRSMLGTFAPQQEPYVHIMPEAHVIPSGQALAPWPEGRILPILGFLMMMLLVTLM
jgi:hypothetical protein